jgi:hypothetical protein
MRERTGGLPGAGARSKTDRGARGGIGAQRVHGRGGVRASGGPEGGRRRRSGARAQKHCDVHRILLFPPSPRSLTPSPPALRRRGSRWAAEGGAMPVDGPGEEYDPKYALSPIFSALSLFHDRDHSARARTGGSSRRQSGSTSPVRKPPKKSLSKKPSSPLPPPTPLVRPPGEHHYHNLMRIRLFHRRNITGST